MKKVLLSFDIEEFDMPLEYGKKLPFNQQIEFSEKGTGIILDVLCRQNIKATFFSTVVFALEVPQLISRIIDDGHELASHGYFHSKFQNSHLRESREKLSTLSGKDIFGFRMPRMARVDNQSLIEAGYLYNSSLNPVFLPGRYNNFFEPRTLFKKGSLIHLPSSATPILRLPLFWLSFHNFPGFFYQWACARTINVDHYLNIYFHPWEFMDLRHQGLPHYVTRNSGSKMCNRFEALIIWMKSKGYEFSTIINFLETLNLR